MSQRDLEMLVPRRVLGVWDDARARHGGASDADGDVRVAGDDLAVVVTVLFALLIAGDRGAAGVESREESAEALREHVHVRKKPSLNDSEIEVPVEVHHGVGFLSHRHHWIEIKIFKISAYLKHGEECDRGAFEYCETQTRYHTQRRGSVGVTALFL